MADHARRKLTWGRRRSDKAIRWGLAAMVALNVFSYFTLQHTQDQLKAGRVEGTGQRCELARAGLQLAQRSHALNTEDLALIVSRCEALLDKYKREAR